MLASEELNLIKKKYGESFMHLCRKLFPTILEDDGKLSSILRDYFATNNRALGQIITEKHLESEFKEFIYSKLNSKGERIDNPGVTSDKEPYELLSEVDYQLHECHSEEEIQDYRKYYPLNEALCTFHGGRLEKNFVFFAIKKNALDIKREDFDKPVREDEYGRSVLSIQFPKEKRTTAEIISRYNHAVDNPNATFGNDLDEIVPGLTDSFAKLLKERGCYYSNSNIEKISIPGYVVGPDKKYYKYNCEANGIYFCPGNIILDGSNVRTFSNGKAIVMDNHMFDIHEKKFRTIDDEEWYKGFHDSFIDAFFTEDKDNPSGPDISNIEKVVVKKNFQKKENRIVEIYLKDEDKNEPIIIELNKDNQIVGYSNKYLTKIGNNFMENNTTLEWLDLPNVESIGKKFLDRNNSLKGISLPKVIDIGDDFMSSNKVLEVISAPNLRTVGNDFLAANTGVRKISFKNLEIIGDNFMRNNSELRSVYIPRVVRIGNFAFTYNKMISEISCPRVTDIGRGFMENNTLLHRIYMPFLQRVGSSFCYSNTQMEEIDFPNLVTIGSHFFANNEIARILKLPKAQRLGECFMQSNLYVEKIDMPEVVYIKSFFMNSNVIATEINMPKVENIDQNFMMSNTQMRIVNMQMVGKVVDKFLPQAKNIEVMNTPKLREAPPSVRLRQEEIKRKDVKKVVDSVFIMPIQAKKIKSKDIAELDKQEKIGRTEVRMSKGILEKLIELCKPKTR